MNDTKPTQIHATGEVSTTELSCWMHKCDIMIQPYPDGVSSRRSSVMAALCYGLPIVTTGGSLTEEVWAQSGAAALVPPGDVSRFLNAANDLLGDEQKRAHMGVRARRLYVDRFDVRHTIRALRAAREPNLALCES